MMRGEKEKKEKKKRKRKRIKYVFIDQKRVAQPLFKLQRERESVLTAVTMVGIKYMIIRDNNCNRNIMATVIIIIIRAIIINRAYD